MPKLILEFTQPEDASEIYAAVNGMSLYLLLWDLDQHLRKIIKYDGDPVKVRHYEEIRDWLHDSMRVEGLSFEQVE